jgi:hypothetical protein
MRINIPDFGDFIRTPKNPNCKPINTKNLVLEILWWDKTANNEFLKWENVDKLEIEWDKALTLRYKREKDWITYPICVLSYEEIENTIRIKQLQWSNNKKVSFRAYSSLEITHFYLKLVEDSFLSKWIDVTIEKPGNIIWNNPWASKSYWTYRLLYNSINTLRKKYWFI